MPDNYPNLMCYGRDCDKCGHEDTCPNYLTCKDQFIQSWFTFARPNPEAEEE